MGIDMKESKREKAVKQVLASLYLDRLYVKPAFVSSYCNQHNITFHKEDSELKLSLKRRNNNVSK